MEFVDSVKTEYATTEKKWRKYVINIDPIKYLI